MSVDAPVTEATTSSEMEAGSANDYDDVDEESIFVDDDDDDDEDNTNTSTSRYTEAQVDRALKVITNISKKPPGKFTSESLRHQAPPDASSTKVAHQVIDNLLSLGKSNQLVIVTSFDEDSNTGPLAVLADSKNGLSTEIAEPTTIEERSKDPNLSDTYKALLDKDNLLDIVNVIASSVADLMMVARDSTPKEDFAILVKHGIKKALANIVGEKGTIISSSQGQPNCCLVAEGPDNFKLEVVVNQLTETDQVMGDENRPICMRSKNFARFVRSDTVIFVVDIPRHHADLRMAALLPGFVVKTSKSKTAENKKRKTKEGGANGVDGSVGNKKRKTKEGGPNASRIDP
ncbi:hypothetical protein TrCOL_g6638 [Triparma columacea]|uniref:Uncharacterized protein n=1 Tax=Triparma columacea TaxID=722753 RepID=A0A9W7LCM8_9STRA|nr:hypothetical protein TrCOL_g6638 [Triparma columacea]